MSASRERKLRQAQVDTPLTEKEKKEAKQAKSLKIQTTIFIVVCVLMVAVLVAFAVLNTGIVERNATALTVGEHKISAAEMNYFYVNEANNYYSQNADFLGYFISPTTPLDKQVLSSETGATWADQFMDMAVTKARDVYAIYDEAVKSGFELSQTDKDNIDAAIDSLSTIASFSGASSANAYLRSFFGRGCNTATYRHFLTVQQTVSAYTSQYVDGISYTDEDLAEYEAKDPLKYNNYDFRYYFVAAQDYYESDAPTDEEKAAAQKTAKEEAEQMAAASQGNEAAFIEMANEMKAKTSDDTDSSTEYDASTATLYTDIERDNVNTTIADWITDPSRKEGDCEAIVSKSTVDGQEDQIIGYYVAFFLNTTDNSDVFTKDVRHILISGSTDESKAKAEELLSKFSENPTEENFAALATENTEDPGSKDNGGLYEAVQPGQMEDAFNDWCFTEDHKPGDYGLIQTSYGYHLMYMVGDNVSCRKAMIVSDYQSDVYAEWYTGVTEAYTQERGSGMSWVNTGIYLQNSNS